jgi:hypothetical protein
MVVVVVVVVVVPCCIGNAGSGWDVSPKKKKLFNTADTAKLGRFNFLRHVPPKASCRNVITFVCALPLYSYYSTFPIS